MKIILNENRKIVNCFISANEQIPSRRARCSSKQMLSTRPGVTTRTASVIQHNRTKEICVRVRFKFVFRTQLNQSISWSNVPILTDAHISSLGYLCYHTKLWRDIWCTESKTISFSNCQIIVPCEAIKRVKALRRETYNVVEINLVCWWMSARIEH